jgi:hypothetical protein
MRANRLSVENLPTTGKFEAQAWLLSAVQHCEPNEEVKRRTSRKVGTEPAWVSVRLDRDRSIGCREVHPHSVRSRRVDRLEAVTCAII